MSKPSRRRFLRSSAAISAGFVGLRATCHPAFADNETDESEKHGYGPLFSDADGILDLPAKFKYSIISKQETEMNDGLVVPGAPDGMGTFAGPYGLTVIVRNHELTPTSTGPFGEKRKLLNKVPKSKLYDNGRGKTPSAGGTTTMIYDTKSQTKVREFLSLGGTLRNCAGGITPWNSWITCEETDFKAGEHGEKEEERFVNEKDHGYNFEVPVSARMELAEPIPLKEMGRFNHEAVAVDPKTGIVYQTEDRDDGLFYRFLPNRPGDLRAGGKLQALLVEDKKGTDTRNWEDKDNFYMGQDLAVRWIDIENVESPEDDLRKQGLEKGAAIFARGEGIWYGSGTIYFACTSGGKGKVGQIWTYRPSYDEGTKAESKDPGKLELFIEPNDSELVHNADNLTIAPWGDLVVCEDRAGKVVRLVGVTPEGKCYPFAFSHERTEFAGVCFSPDGSTLFVNMQGVGLTLAIRGPWHSQLV